MADVPPDDESSTRSPFHAGERELQQRAGVRERMEQVGRTVIRDHLIEHHREFFPLLPHVLLAALDETGCPCATMLAGPPGFVHTPDATHLRIDRTPAADDPLHGRLTAGAAVAVLGLQAHTRRRNRVNGVVASSDDVGLTIEVRQSFGNCPKYIQAREARWRGEAVNTPATRAGGPVLEASAQALVARADTFFVASSSAAALDMRAAGSGIDVSHRGGRPGFVRVDERNGHSELLIPDFIGNFYFNTLGNLLVQPRCGLLFVDHDDGSVLHVAGRAEIDWDGASSQAFAGAERAWRVVVERSLWRERALPLDWSGAEFAAQLDATGAWS